MKLFYTGPLVNAEMLVTMLEKHGIQATQEFEEPDLPDDGVVRLFRDRSQRGGKVVTVVRGLRERGPALERLAGEPKLITTGYTGSSTEIGRTSFDARLKPGPTGLCCRLAT